MSRYYKKVSDTLLYLNELSDKIQLDNKRTRFHLWSIKMFLNISQHDLKKIFERDNNPGRTWKSFKKQFDTLVPQFLEKGVRLLEEANFYKLPMEEVEALKTIAGRNNTVVRTLIDLGEEYRKAKGIERPVVEFVERGVWNV